VSRSAWIGDYVDPNTFLDLMVTGGENNKTGWGNPRYDELIRQAARELDAEMRLALFAEAEGILMEELPVLPIYYYVSQNLVAPRLGGFYENLQDEHAPKFWYWMSDEELAERRATYPPGVELVPALGPPAGLYPPAGRRAPW
jgi:oligopeptide transport system substrate-binding protein